ncbi:MAG: YicC/YloC family endoribonuclease [Verrucomicrobiota bacterium JB023]|nr:YicC/YloC family endoribonuclease [Verrucomicrobiota bacterium JB023]
MHSMTGFGRGEHTTAQYRVEVEASSVNRKQAEVSLNIPRGLSALESALRKHALTHFSRGRLTLAVKLTTLDPAATSFAIDENRAAALQNSLSQLGERLGTPLPLSATDILRLPELFLGEETQDPDELLPIILPALDQALTAWNEMRRTEGEDLREDLTQRLTILQSLASEIGSIAPTVPTRQRELLLHRLSEAGLGIDPQDERVIKELALFAERCDISEELTRLDSHFQKFTTLLNQAEPSGRSLDFLCQELNREFNTVGSKANHAGIAHHVVSAKTELEKIREQVQNLE